MANLNHPGLPEGDARWVALRAERGPLQGVTGAGGFVESAHWKVKRRWHLTPSDRRIMYGIVLPGPNVQDGVPDHKGRRRLNGTSPH